MASGTRVDITAGELLDMESDFKCRILTNDEKVSVYARMYGFGIISISSKTNIRVSITSYDVTSLGFKIADSDKNFGVYDMVFTESELSSSAFKGCFSDFLSKTIDADFFKTYANASLYDIIVDNLRFISKDAKSTLPTSGGESKGGDGGDETDPTADDGENLK